jgi:ribosomal protein L39E
VSLLFNIFSLNLGSRKWKSNNLQLARENARLKKDVQKWVKLHTGETVRYNVLEMAWRRRGVSNFRLCEGVSPFDFIRPWITSFENIVGVIHQQNM